jgi:ribonuclease Z
MKLTFLGTGCMVPTKDRNVQGIFLKYKNKGLLFDCGEGTQRQMSIAGLKRTDINYIFISHWHGDHVGGLLPLLMTLSNVEPKPTIRIFGPKGSKEKLNNLFKSSFFDNELNVELTEIDAKTPSKILDSSDFEIFSANMTHQVPCVGYSFIEKDIWNISMSKAKKEGLEEGPLIGKILRDKKVKIKGKIVKLEEVAKLKKGKKITIILDTSLNNNCVKLAKHSSLLITESTYHSDLEEKARKNKHLTSKDSALIASKSESEKLCLTHFSQRYKEVSELEKEAKTFFKNTIIAKDFLNLKI